MFFDWTWNKCQKEIKKFMCKINKEMGEKWTMWENNVQHQKKGWECGVYSVHFLFNMINGVDFEKYCKNINCDDHIETFRLSIFWYE